SPAARAAADIPSPRPTGRSPWYETAIGGTGRPSRSKTRWAAVAAIPWIAAIAPSSGGAPGSARRNERSAVHSSASPRASKPGPRLAEVAGTRTRTESEGASGIVSFGFVLPGAERAGRERQILL